MTQLDVFLTTALGFAMLMLALEIYHVHLLIRILLKLFEKEKERNHGAVLPGTDNGLSGAGDSRGADALHLPAGPTDNAVGDEVTPPDPARA